MHSNTDVCIVSMKWSIWPSPLAYWSAMCHQHSSCFCINSCFWITMSQWVMFLLWKGHQLEVPEQRLDARPSHQFTGSESNWKSIHGIRSLLRDIQEKSGHQAKAHWTINVYWLLELYCHPLPPRQAVPLNADTLQTSGELIYVTADQQKKRSIIKA